jgi:Protein of unknown function (DUF3631)
VRVHPIPTTRPEGAALLAELHAALCRYVILPSAEAADAVTLWVAASHAQPAWEHAPRLAVVSPLKRCGKSRLLDVVAETCHAPLITVNATIAAVVRSIGQDPPTLLVDEADTLWGSKRQADNNEDLRGLLNAGHQRNRPMLRWDVTSRTAEHLDTFAMAMLAAIGELPDTIMDRAVVVRMRRRAPGERVDPYRTRRDVPPLNQLRGRLNGWAREHLGELQHAQPVMPLEDRAADTWEPLVAVADLARADWPERARTAAATMTAAEAEQEEDTSASVRLLGDLRGVFDQAGAEALYSATILAALHKLDEAPWADWYGHPLHTRDLAKLLRAYGVRPHDVREHGTGPQRKGYARADLYEPWARYLPRQPRHARHDDEPAAQPSREPVADPEVAAATSATAPGLVADVADPKNPSATGLSSQNADVADVAHPPHSNGAPAHRAAPGSAWAPNGAARLAPDPDQFGHHDEAGRSRAGGRLIWTSC